MYNLLQGRKKLKFYTLTLPLGNLSSGGMAQLTSSDSASKKRDEMAAQLDSESAFPVPTLLPGFGESSACWKCRGSGKRSAGAAMGARQRKRLARSGGVDDGSCVVCAGAGALPRTGKLASAAAAPGRVTAPRSAASVARGPAVAGAGAPGAGEELCCLTGAWRILQRVGGHRYSTEDVVTAYVAAGLAAGESKVRHADLGCGVGSVLQMVAWRCAEAETDYRGVGVEAQRDSADLARRSVAYNGADAEVVDGDLRSFDAPPWEAGAFCLATGTPPYFNVSWANGKAATDFGAFPNCEQSAGARYEFRGGVEAYCDAGARVLRSAPDPATARFVCCEGGLHVNLRRVAAAADAAGLRILAHLPVVGREGKPPLFGVWTMALGAPASPPPPPDPPLVVRDADGGRTPRYARVLEAMAMT